MKKNQITHPLYIYLHTHWDREWCLPFNAARAILLDKVRKTLAALEARDLPNFYLDGQAVVLEDVSEIDVDLGQKIKNLMGKGLLSAGPWYVLGDQSLVSGESLVRNIKIGIETTKKFGPPTMTGYNPDTFCHVQDLPRILNGFNIDTTIVFRGVPLAGKDNIFYWQSPDGSKVLTYWLNKGLSHAIFHNTNDIQKIAEYLSSWWTDENGASPVLFSAGQEYAQAPGDFKSKLNALNNILPDGRKTKAVSMEEFLDILKKWAKSNKLPELSGDLRDNSNISEKFPAYVLDGVSSTRLYLKRANALTEHRLIRMIEPLFAMFNQLGIMSYPEKEMHYIWKLLLQNHPHDSICGCSVDPVHQEMMTRTQQINSFLDGLDNLALECVNNWSASSKSSSNLLELALPAVTVPQANDHTSSDNSRQVFNTSITKSEEEKPISGNNRLLLFNTSSFGLRAPVKMSWYCNPDATISTSTDNIQIESNELESHHLFYSGDGMYYQPARCVQGWIYPNEVPAMGYSEQIWSDESGPQSTKCMASSSAQIIRTNNIWKIDNGLMNVEIDKSGKLVATVQISGYPREFVLGHNLYDVGDGGDTYNFDPLPNDVPIKAQLINIEAGKPGPLVSSLVLTYEIDIPKSLDPKTSSPEFCDSRKRSKELIKHNIKTEIILKKGVPILFFETIWDNYSLDHRLEVRFDTGRKVKETLAEQHFSIAKHVPIIEKPKLPVAVGHEIPADSYFCQRFFIASEQAFFNCGLPEYRIDDTHVSITLLRAVSYLSRGRLRTRGGGAGPWYATPEANCLGENRCTYGWTFLEAESIMLDESQNSIVRAYQLADLFEGRLIPFACGTFEAERKQSIIEISNPALYLPAMYIDKGNLFIRLLNVTMSAQSATIKIHLPITNAGRVNLLGEDFQPLPIKKESSYLTLLDLNFKANELMSLQLNMKKIN